ncbi:hypothetical protein HPHPH3_1598 [Helicobacter pylori Hp H-3]|nr:hypothetical protein HPHPH3_1598 [Helicobacter pylori Hp H-3]
MTKKPLSIQVNEKRLMKKRFIHSFSNPTTPLKTRTSKAF